MAVSIFQKVTRNAILAMGAFSSLTAIALVAWFASADSPWGFASFIALLSLLGGIATTALLWRQPIQKHALAAIGVMAFSILRVGAPSQWTWASVALVTLTALLSVPVVYAATVLPRG